jgi:hypothetical protein
LFFALYALFWFLAGLFWGAVHWHLSEKRYARATKKEDTTNGKQPR